MDIAELGLSIRSDGVVVATDRLKALEGQAGRTEKAGVLLAKAFTVLTAAFSVSRLIDYTNRWTDLSSRVEIATGSIGQGAATMQRLSEMARRTYSSLDLTAESFLLNATAMREMGATTGQTLDYVEAINNALVVSGAKGDRAASVMDALSKAMALGKLSGDNLNTVISTGGRVAEALAESMGVTTLELRALGAAGKITSKDIIGITSQLELLRGEADSMPATIGDAFTLLGNSILTMVGQFDQANGASSRVAEAIIWVADAMNQGTISIERMLAMATAMALFMGGSWVAGFVAANGAVALLTGGLALLRTAMIRTGIGALIVLAGELIYQLFKVVDGAGSVEEAFDRLGASGRQTWERIVSGGEFMAQSISAFAYQFTAVYLKAWADIQNGFFNMLRQLQGATGIAIPGMAEFEDSIMRQYEAQIKAQGNYLEAQGKARDALNAMFEDKSTATGIGRMPSFGELASTLGAPGSINAPAGVDKAAEKAAEKYKELVRGANQFIESQRLEVQVLGMTAEAANALRYEQDLLNQAANDNIALTPKMRLELEGLAGAMAAAEEGARLMTEAYTFGKDVFTGFFGDLKKGITEGQSLWESLGNAAVSALDKIADRALSMAANGIFDMIFGSLMSGITGGFGGNFMGGSFGAPALQLGFQKGIPGFDGGGYTGSGARSGGIDGKGGFLATLHPDETVIDHTRGGNDNSASSGITINNIINVPAGAGPETAPAIAREVTRELRRQLPDAIQTYNRNPLRRAS